MTATDLRDLRQLLVLNDLTEVGRQAERLIRQAGFTGYVYALANAGDWRQSGWTPLINGYGRRWIDRYVASGYARVDPIPDYCFGMPRYAPLLWRYDTAPARAFAEDALTYGIGAGVSHPITTPAGRRGGFSFALNARGREADEYIVELHAWTCTLTSYVHDAYARLKPGLSDAGQSAHPEPLSTRELTCLQWSAVGKTASEVAERLNITERTVKYHLGNARSKFGVSTTREAVARAIRLQLIQG